MAQLPPKVPPMTQNWASFNYQMMPSAAAAAAVAATAAQPPYWVDEFLDFSSNRRNVHRRSVSDSIAFIQLGEDCRNSNSPAALMSGNNGFDGLDDEQLMNMFADDGGVAAPPMVSDPSTPSDQNSDDDEKPAVAADHHREQRKNEAGEEESSCKFDPDKPAPPSAATSGDTVFDPKRVKRILANRQSAQRSRVRKLQYISELERSVSTLQNEVSALSPRVAFLDHQRLILNVDNSTLKQRIAALAQDKIFKDAHQEALKKEIERLRQVYHQQSLKNMGNNTATTTAPPPPTSNNTGCPDN